MPEDSLQQGQPGINDEAVIGFDATGRVISTSASAAAVLGYDGPEELYGVSISQLTGSEAAARLLGQRQGSPASVSHPVTMTFVRHDGKKVSLNAFVNAEDSGGWITLLDPRSGGSAHAGNAREVASPPDVAAILRRLAEQTASIGDINEITSRFAGELHWATGADAVTVARSTEIAGIYEPIARAANVDGNSLTETIDLPAALIPQQGEGPITIGSLDTLALFEPVVIFGDEFDGAYLASRSDLHDGAHLLIIATADRGSEWVGSASLLLEAGALTLAGTLRAAELDRRIANYSRTSETVRQIGALAARDHDGGFLDSARKIIARRLPVSAISIHVADPVSDLCYVPEASSAGGYEHGALAPAGEWQLAGSIEQRVLKTGAPVFTSASSSERLSVPAATIAHWRACGLQAVTAIPMREAGQVVAVMLAGFSSPVRDPKEVIRLLESIAPAVHLGVGLSVARPVATPTADDSQVDPGFVSPGDLLAIVRAASESPDVATLFASVTELMMEVVPSSRVTWGLFDRGLNQYQRMFSYDAAMQGQKAVRPVHLDATEVAGIDLSGLRLREPGDAGDVADSMRAAVATGNHSLGIVTAQPAVDSYFTGTDLARLERICEFVAGPLTRVLESDAARRSSRKRELVAEIGAMAAEFHDPSHAMRSMRSQLGELFRHDRALFAEFDHRTDTVTVRYDSATLPDEAEISEIPMSALPSPSLVSLGEPETVRIDRDMGVAGGDLAAVFEGYESIFAVPVASGDERDAALFLLSEHAYLPGADEMELARSLSIHLKGALARWQAYRTTRESRHQLIDMRKKLSLILDSAPVALISIDTDGICRDLEGHGLDTLGIKREDLHGQSIFDWTGGMPQVEGAIKQAMRGELATVLTSLGSYWIEVWAQPVTATDGSVTGVTLVGYDVSDRMRTKQANAEKRELKAVLEERASVIERASHELRNQLQSIIAYADVLSFGSVGKLGESQTHALAVIQKTADKLDRMIGDLPGLDYELGISDVDVSSLMLEIVDAQEQIFTAAGQTLSLALPEEFYSVQADHLRLTQVVTNLLSNASKYSPPGAAVSIEVTVVEDVLHICVADTGPGIPADQLERVWDTGIRLTSSGTSSVKGSGLGLAIVRKITEMHGGTASITSEVGFGTRVTVTLPGVALMKGAVADGEPVADTAPEATASDPPAKTAARSRRRRS